MQFEDFDNKIRQAADQHHPNYDEKAWAKMEKLLDHELPQKEDRRRRFILLLFLFLLLGGGAWLIIDQPWQNDRISDSRTKDASTRTPGAGATVTSTNEKETTAKKSSPIDDKKQEDVSNNNSDATNSLDPTQQAGATTKSNTSTVTKGNNDVVISADQAGKIQQQKKNTTQAIRKANNTGNDNLDIQVIPGSTVKKQKETIKKDNKPAPQKDDAKLDITSSGNISSAAKPSASDNNSSTDMSNNNVAKADNTKDDKKDDKVVLQAEDEKLIQSKKDSSAEKVAAPAPKENKVAKPARNKKKNTLFFSLSAGPDISTVGLQKPGKVRIATGAGIGYTIKDRLTIRTGFYSADKVYDAKPSSYKPDAPLQWPDMIKRISADCKVYEIPLTVAWNFGKSPKHNFFASTGLSSFIMKKEKYSYYYYYPGNPNPFAVYTHEENNKYKHYFSVLSLSGGYQRRINNTFSVMVEPYFKLPLSGVGYGNINLNSAGVLFTLTASPFK